jgi:hypothetical protein
MSVTVTVDDTKLLKLIAATKSPVKPAIVADGVEYGKYLEFGTERMGARPCARPAVEIVRPGFEKAFIGQITTSQAQAVVDKTATNIERGWKQTIVQKNVIDTGAYLGSVHIIRGGGP